MSYLLEVVHLAKHYGPLKAVDDVSFGIREGVCFGLLGPNGAGKTTTIEVIEDIKPASSGEILYRGQPRDHRFAEVAGIQFQSTALQDYLSVREVVQLFANLYPRTTALEPLIRLCHLEEFLDQQANKLSGGQKQRLLLALALVNDPEIVFLDEPTTGLDPQSRRNFWALIDDIKAAGKTVILTTHYMDEAETLCDELIIMDHGQIVDQGSPRQLLDKYLPDKRVSVSRHAAALNPSDISGRVEARGEHWEIHTQSVEQTLQELMAQSVDLSSLRVRNPTLEDLFIKLTGHQLRE